MGENTQQIVIVTVVVLGLLAAMLTSALFIKKRMKDAKEKKERRVISTIQSAYDLPVSQTTPECSSNQDACPNGIAPGWNIVNLDVQPGAVNIRHPSAAGVVIPREPVVYSQSGNIHKY